MLCPLLVVCAFHFQGDAIAFTDRIFATCNLIATLPQWGQVTLTSSCCGSRWC
jgi:hypothetical protein